ncbi:MAG TPA: hypothetical protein VNW94_03375 [Streptosporangiaceae bacterium]|jgi:hypothetical protein|nr:hypothetical protein [Streptosporangiaceae bacterium]
MSCEHLICAQCAGPVVEGRCATCRAARAELHHHHGSTVPPALILTALVLLFALVLVLRHLVLG